MNNRPDSGNFDSVSRSEMISGSSTPKNKNPANDRIYVEKRNYKVFYKLEMPFKIR
jgi:hypothetical protein